MMNSPQGGPLLKSFPSQTIVWKNGGDYLEYLNNFVHQEQTTFIDVARKLTAAGLMTSAEASAIKPHLEITIVDRRTDRAIPLPDTGQLGENVIVKMQLH